MNELMKKKYDEAKAFCELYEKATGAPESKSTARREAAQTTPKTAAGTVDLSTVTNENVDKVVGESKLTVEQMKKLTSRQLYNLATRTYKIDRAHLANKDMCIETLTAIFDGTFEGAASAPEEKKTAKAATADAGVATYKGEKNVMKIGKLVRDRGLATVAETKTMTKAELIQMLLDDDEAGGATKATTAGKGKAKAAPKKDASNLTKAQKTEAMKLWKELKEDYDIEAPIKQHPDVYKKMIADAEAAANEDDDWGDESVSDDDGWDDL